MRWPTRRTAARSHPFRAARTSFHYLHSHCGGELILIAPPAGTLVYIPRVCVLRTSGRNPSVFWCGHDTERAVFQGRSERFMCSMSEVEL